MRAAEALELTCSDAIDNFDQYLADELGAQVAMLEETAYAAGDGSGKPLGLTHTSSGYTVVTAATGSATSFKLADVRSAYDALPVAYRPNASWIFSPSAFSSLAGLTDTAGGLVLPNLHAAEPSLFGRPVYVSPDFPAAAASARSAFFGDLSLAYAVRRARSMGMSRQDEIFSNNGQIGFRLFERVDGPVSFKRKGADPPLPQKGASRGAPYPARPGSTPPSSSRFPFFSKRCSTSRARCVIR